MYSLKPPVKRIIIPENSRLCSSEFIYGVGTSAYQIEGGAESREPNIWDTFCKKPGAIADQTNADISCNHDKLWQQDIELINALNVDAYRFSIAWSKVINADGTLNQKGIGFYHKILDRLNEYGIKSFVTLYHWDLPQNLEDKGGWLNRDMAFYFSDYVQHIANSFKGKVYSYATLNEPYCSAHLGYETGIHAPGLIGKQYGKKAGHHLLLAHGLGMQVLQNTSPESKNGIVVNVTPMYAATNNIEDIKATEIADQEFNHWYIKPLIDGKYPDLLQNMDEQDRPVIHENDLKIISTAINYLGINYYTRYIIQADQKDPYKIIEPSNAPVTEMGWEIYPKGYFDILTQLNNQYQLPPIYLTESGAAMPDILVDGEVMDIDRIDYLQDHLCAVDQAIKMGVDIQSYFAWSLMDNFEWSHGYTKRFGLVYVDYDNQQRTIKQSGLAFREFIADRKHDVETDFGDYDAK